MPGRCLSSGDTAKGEAVADGAAAAGIDAEEAARGAPGGVQAGDDLAIEVDYFCLGVDLKAAKGMEAARGLGTIDGVIRRGVDGLEEISALVALGVIVGGTVPVVPLYCVDDVVNRQGDHLGELIYSICLGNRHEILAIRGRHGNIELGLIDEDEAPIGRMRGNAAAYETAVGILGHEAATVVVEEGSGGEVAVEINGPVVVDAPHGASRRADSLAHEDASPRSFSQPVREPQIRVSET